MASEVPRPKMPFQDRMEPGRKDLMDATLETNLLEVVYSDRWVTVRDLLNVIGKSYGTVHGCIWEHLNMKIVSTRSGLRLYTG